LFKQAKFHEAILAQKKQEDGVKFLCSPCKTVFTDVLQELESVEKITAEALKPAIDSACDKWTGKIQFVDNACKEIAETAVEDLAQWLIDEEKKVNPERTCIYLHMC
jgi:hypothetical protein